MKATIIRGTKVVVGSTVYRVDSGSAASIILARVVNMQARDAATKATRDNLERTLPHITAMKVRATNGSSFAFRRANEHYGGGETRQHGSWAWVQHPASFFVTIEEAEIERLKRVCALPEAAALYLADRVSETAKEIAELQSSLAYARERVAEILDATHIAQTYTPPVKAFD